MTQLKLFSRYARTTRRVRSTRRPTVRRRHTCRSGAIGYESLEDRRLLAVLDVTTSQDIVNSTDGQLSLREAIIQSNQLIGPDTIRLAPDTYNLAITGSGEDAAATGDLDITDDLSIQRLGTSGQVVIDATGLGDRVFHVIAPLVSFDPLETGNGSSIATETTKLNDLDVVTTDFQAGDKLEIQGQNPNGSQVSKSEFSVNTSTTVGDLLNEIESLFDNVSASIDDQGRISVTGDGSSFVGAMELEVDVSPLSTGEASFPGLIGASVSLDNVTIRRGSGVDFGAGLFNQNQAVVTINESAFENNEAALEGGAFLNDVTGLRGGLVQLTNTSLRSNIVSGGADPQDLLSGVSNLLQSNEDSFLVGMDATLGDLSDRIDGAFSALDIPVIGDQLIDGLRPVFQGINDLATGVRDTLADLFELASNDDGLTVTELIQHGLFMLLSDGDGSSFSLLPAASQAALTPFQSRFASLGLGILQDGGDTGTDVDPTDVVVTIGQDRRGKRWLEYNFHIGQRETVDTPDFALGLGNLTDFVDGLPATEQARLRTFLNDMGFEFEATNGIRFDMRWDLRLGLGVSDLDGQDFYINSGATTTGALDATPVEELRAVIDVFAAPANEAAGFSELSEDVVTTPNLRADVNLGLMQATVTDGTPAAVTLTAPRGLPLVGPFDNSFRLTYTDGDGDHAIDIDFNTFAATPADFVLSLNADLFADDPSFPISATLDFSRINRGTNADAGTTPSLVFNARFPDINNLKIDFALRGGNAEQWGFIDGQVEDSRAKALGFSNNVSSSLVGAEQVLEAALNAPAEGKLLSDIKFVLWLGGTRNADNILVDAEKVSVVIRELFNRDIDSLESLRAKVQDVVQSLVTSSTSFDGSTIEVRLNGDKLQLISTAGDRLTVTAQQIDQTKLQLIAAIDAIDPDFEDEGNLLNLKANPTDTRFFDRLSRSDLDTQDTEDVLKPILKASADVNLHVDTNSDFITGAIEQALGLAEGTIGLPSLDFDFKIVGADLDFTTLFNNDNSDDDQSVFSVKALQFDNITLDVTETLESMVAPFAETVLGALEPLFHVLGETADDPDSVLNTEVPLIGDIVGEPVTIGDIIETFGLSGVVDAFFEFVEPLQNFDASAIAQEIAGANGEIVFGGMELVFDKESAFYFPKIELPVPIGLAETVDGGAGAASSSSVLTTVTATEIVPGIFNFDLLSVDSIFNMLIGAPFNIVSVGLPEVDIEAEADFGFDFDALSFNIDASADVDVNLRLVYDSLGLQRVIDAFRSNVDPEWADLIDGFHIQNNPGGEPELGLAVEFFGEGSVDVAGFAAEGFVDAAGSIAFDIVDPDDDGKLRLDEIFALTNDFADPENLLCMFDITGSGHFNAGGSASYEGVEIASGEMGLVGGDFSLQDLLSSVFDICDDVTEDFQVAEPILASEIFENGQRVLRIHTGPFAPDRIHQDIDDTDATSGVEVVVGQLAGGSYEVSITDPQSSSTFLQDGSSQTFTPSSGSFDRIVAVGSEFGDTFDFSGVSIPVEVTAGAGNDTVDGGDAGDRILGELDDDTLNGHGGPDVILGGRGDDTVDGGAGDDEIDGQFGNDPLLAGGEGSDTIRGGRGNDRIEGGGGNDNLFGDAGVDHVFGGPGNDHSSGGRGNDVLDDRSGSDSLVGDLGADRLIVGRDSDSLVDGGAGVNVIEFADDHLDLEASKSLAESAGAVLRVGTIQVATLSSTFSNVDSIEINLGDGEDVFTIESTDLPVRFNGEGSAADADRLIIDRSSAVGPVVGEVTDGVITGLTVAEIAYTNTEQLELLLGQGADGLSILSTAANMETEVFAGAGDDQVIVSGVADGIGTSIKGEDGDDEVRLLVADDPNDSVDLSNFDELALTTERLFVDHRGGTTAVDWLDDRNVVWFQSDVGSSSCDALGVGTLCTQLVQADGVDRVVFQGGDSGSDTLTVTDSVDNPQFVTIDRDSVVIVEGAEILTLSSQTRLDRSVYDATVNRLGGFVATAVAQTGEQALPPGVGAQTHLYAVSATDDAIVVFRKEADGHLTFLQEITDGDHGLDGLNGPTDVVVSSDGTSVYVSSDIDNDIVHFQRIPQTGRLVYRGSYSRTISVNGLAATDANLYAISGDDLLHYSRDPSSGELTFVQSTAGSETHSFEAVDITADGLNLYAVSNAHLDHFQAAANGNLSRVASISRSGNDIEVGNGSVYVAHDDGVSRYNTSLGFLGQRSEAGNPTAEAIAIRPDGKVIVSIDDTTADVVPDRKYVSFKDLKVIDRIDTFTNDEGKFFIDNSSWTSPDQWIDEGEHKDIGGPNRKRLNSTRTLKVKADLDGGEDGEVSWTVSPSTSTGTKKQTIIWNATVFGADVGKVGEWDVRYVVESEPQPQHDPPKLVMYDASFQSVVDSVDSAGTPQYADITSAFDNSFYGGASSRIGMWSSGSTLSLNADGTVGDGDGDFEDGETQSDIELLPLGENHAETVTYGKFAYTVSAKYGALWVSEQNNSGGYDQIQQVPVPGLIDDAGLTVVGSFIYVTVPTEDTVLVFNRSFVNGTVATTPTQTLTDGLEDKAGNTVDGLSGAREVAFKSGHIYVTGAAEDELAIFARDVNSGELEYVSTIKTGLNRPTDILFSSNDYAYVASEGTSSVVVFQRDDNDGSLTKIQSVGAAGDAPYQLALNDSEDTLYLANGDDSILVFKRNTTDGTLSLVQTVLGTGLESVLPLEGLSAIVADDQYVFATGKKADTVAAFLRDPGTGRLTYQQRLRDGASGINLGDLDDPTSTSIAAFGDNLVVTSGDAGAAGRGLAVFDIQRTLPDPLSFRAEFEGIEALTVTSAGGADDITLVESIAALPVTINGGSNDDFFFVNGTTIGGSTTINADGPSLKRTDLTASGFSGDNPNLSGDVLIFDTKGAETNPNLQDGKTDIYEIDGSRFSFASSGDIQVVGEPLGVHYTSMEEVRRIAGPTADAGGPYRLVEGNGIQLDASDSIIPNRSVSGTPIYEWDLDNDGVYDDITTILDVVNVGWADFVAHGLDNGGVYEIGLRVSNNIGSDIARAEVVIADRKVSLVGASSLNEGSAYTLTLGSDSLKKIFAGETIEAGTIDWGDGTTTDLAGSSGTETHTYADNGLRTIRLEAIELLGRGNAPILSEGANSLLVNVDNVTPTLELSGPTQLDEGQHGTYSLFSSDPGDDTINRWDIDWDDVQQTLSGNPATVDHAFLDNGVYFVQATAQDEDGTHVFGGTVAATGATPASFAGPNYLSQVDGTYDDYYVTFTTGALSGQRRQVVDYVGSTRTLTFSDPFFSAPTPGDPFRFLHKVLVKNVAPTIVSTETLTPNATEGSQVAVRVTATDPGSTADPLLYEFDFFDDGSIDAASRNGEARHFFPDDGVFPVRVVVRDDDGASATALFDVSVANVEPTVALDGAAFIDEGDDHRLTLEVTDPGDDTIDQYSIDWGDGTTEVFTFTGDPELTQSHVYTDGDAPITESFTSVATINTTVDSGLFELDLLTLDPSPEISFWNIDWGDGSIASIQGAPDAASHIYAADGNYTVTATSGRQTVHTIRVFGLSDEDTDGVYDAESSLPVTVRNVAPTIDLTGQWLADSRDPFVLELGEVNDPGEDTVSEFRVDWGDGSTFDGNSYQSFDSHPGSIAHTFIDGRDFHEIRVSLVDEDGLHVAAGRLFVSNEGSEISVQLSELIERPSGLQFEYLGSEGTVSSAADTSVVGDPFVDNEVFVVASNKATADDSNATLLFLGQVTAGGRFDVDAATAGLGRLPRTTYLHVFSDVPTTESFSEEVTVTSDELTTTIDLGPLTDDPHVAYWTIDWGDGTIDTIAGDPASIQHAYDTQGTYAVLATAHRLIAEFDSTVDPNIDPALLQSVRLTTTDLNNLQPGDQLGALSITDTTRDSSRYVVKWSDGRIDEYTNDDGVMDSSGALRIDVKHVYPDNGVYEYIVLFRNADGIETEIDRQRVVVNNVAPSILLDTVENTSPGCGSSAEQETISALLHFTDPGFDNPFEPTLEDFFETTIDWGDGAVETVPDISLVEFPGSDGTLTAGEVSGSHVYENGGIFTITITVRDDDGGIAQVTMTTIISGVGLLNGELQIVGTNSDDSVSVNRIKSTSQIRVHSDLVSTGNFRDFPADEVSSITMVLCGGDDHATVAGEIDIDAFIDGGTGDDLLIGGSGNDILLGGPGSDKLLGKEGDDLLIGGDGPDELLGQQGRDILSGAIYDADAQDDDDETASLLSNKQALEQVLAEWTSEKPLSEIIDNITGDDPQADRLNGDDFLKLGDTLTDDDDQDALKTGPELGLILDDDA